MNTRVVSMLMLVSVLASYAVSNAFAADEADEVDDKVYLFAINDFDNRVEYLDNDSHEIKGYHADIVHAVCDIAGKTCELVWETSGSCWYTEENKRAFGGFGLMAQWFTACTAWVPTNERLLTFDFTQPFRQLSKVALYARTGSSQDYSDLSGLKIGFLSSWFSDAACLARYTNIEGADLPLKNQTFYYTTSEDLIAAVDDGSVDVAFSERRPQLDEAMVAISPDDFPNNCAAAGSGMMTQKSNKEFVRWWDEAFSSLVGTDRYDTICQNIKAEHGEMPGDIPEDICIGY